MKFISLPDSTDVEDAMCINADHILFIRKLIENGDPKVDIQLVNSEGIKLAFTTEEYRNNTYERLEKELSK